MYIKSEKHRKIENEYYEEKQEKLYDIEKQLNEEEIALQNKDKPVYEPPEYGNYYQYYRETVLYLVQRSVKKMLSSLYKNMKLNHHGQAHLKVKKNLDLAKQNTHLLLR